MTGEVVRGVRPAVGRRGRDRLSRTIYTALCTVLAIGAIFPLVWLLDFSFAKSNELFSSKLLVWPTPPQWHNYYLALTDGKVPNYLLNSVLITVVCTGLIVVLSVMMSYAFIRMRWKLSRTCLNLVLLGIMIPIHATLLPNFLTFHALDITDTPLALIIPYVAFGLPQATFIMSGFISSVPEEVEESALMDGCGIFRIVFQIVFPLMKPAIVTVIITSYISIWNEFIMAATYLTSDTWRTLPFSVYNFAGMYRSNYAAQFAVMVLAALPSLIVYVLLNKHITKGIVTGAVKG
jgi:raffinose/stachyose/melibiose transport system permease protein